MTLLLSNVSVLLIELSVFSYYGGTGEGDASPMAQTVKNLLAMQETQVRFLCWEVPLKKEMVTHFSILAWMIPWAEDDPTVCGVAKNWA